MFWKRLVIGAFRNIEAFLDSFDALKLSVGHNAHIEFSLDVDSLQISSGVENLTLQATSSLYSIG